MTDYIQNPSLSDGITLHIHDGETPGAFDKYGAIKDHPDMPNAELADVDVTNQDSGLVVKSLPGLMDPGNATVPLTYEAGSSAYDELLALRDSREIRQIKFVFGSAADAPNFAGTGYIKSVSPGQAGGPGQEMTCQVTIRAVTVFDTGTES